jgi:hypothetical protein
MVMYIIWKVVTLLLFGRATSASFVLLASKLLACLHSLVRKCAQIQFELPHGD